MSLTIGGNKNDNYGHYKLPRKQIQENETIKTCLASPEQEGKEGPSMVLQKPSQPETEKLNGIYPIAKEVTNLAARVY
ncbi:hypothetical protein C2G38_2155920 [Gigaspora rosea]|uniref:Uncharacterized protein n=1 Tax=Gigaspora rosea TaxID=44941 RepID=A0A397W3C5_9GLOM|nr:hypothetical protein C2G38_2155920 [Gigaspora rosea]